MLLSRSSLLDPTFSRDVHLFFLFALYVPPLGQVQSQRPPLGVSKMTSKMVSKMVSKMMTKMTSKMLTKMVSKMTSGFTQKRFPKTVHKNGTRKPYPRTVPKNRTQKPKSQQFPTVISIEIAPFVVLNIRQSKVLPERETLGAERLPQEELLEIKKNL